MTADAVTLSTLGISGIVSGGLSSDGVLDKDFFLSLLAICKSKVLRMGSQSVPSQRSTAVIHPTALSALLILSCIG